MAAATATARHRYELKLALPLAAFFLVFFLAPLLLLLFVSLYADTAMTRFGLTQYANFLLDPFSLKVLGAHAVARRRGDGALPAARLSAGLGLSARARLGAGRADPDRAAAAAHQRGGAHLRLDRHPRPPGHRQQRCCSISALIDSPLRLLYTEGGVVVALAQVQMPLMVLPLITALSRIDPNLADASSALGAGYWRTFFKVTLPLSLAGHHRGLPAHLCGGASPPSSRRRWSAAGRCCSCRCIIYQQASTLNNWPFAAAISFIFLVAVLGRRHDLQHAGHDLLRATPMREIAHEARPPQRSRYGQLPGRDVGARWRCCVVILVSPTADRHHRVVHQRLLAEISAARLFAALVRGAARRLAAAFRGAATASRSRCGPRRSSIAARCRRRARHRALEDA